MQISVIKAALPLLGNDRSRRDFIRHSTKPPPRVLRLCIRCALVELTRVNTPSDQMTFNRVKVAPVLRNF